MRYKCTVPSARKKIMNELICDDIHSLYYPNWLIDNSNSCDKANVDPLLGALHSKVKPDVLKNNLNKLAVLIHKFDISENILEKDIYQLIDLCQNPTCEETGLTSYVSSIVSLLFTYPPKISNILYENGIFDRMIENFLESYWMNGLAYFCHFSAENRDTIFENYQIPQQLCKYLDDDKENQYQKILGDIANFVHSLCSYPLINENQFQLISHLISFLIDSIRTAPIDAENSILAALTQFSTLDSNCLNEFSKYNIFQYYSKSESYHPQNIKWVAILMTAVMNSSFDYAFDLANSDDCWQIVLRYFNNLVENPNLYQTGSSIISDAAIIMANVSPDYFIQNSIYLQIIDLYEKLEFDVKSQISMCFYAAFEHASQSQIQFLIENEDYRFILTNYFPDINNSKFIMGATGFLNLFNYLEQNQRGDLISDLIESDDFQSNFSKWFEEQEALKDVPQEINDITSLILSKISPYQDE